MRGARGTARPFLETAMPGFFELAFTPNVQAAQARAGSRDAYAGLDNPQDAGLGPTECAFITARDSFYQATVSETGWPYVQHRGGPPGFLKVLDAHTLGYADFSGNRQYISTGNLAGDDRVCLFLMDYAHQARLKILGRARIVDEDSDPGLMATLDNPAYRARVERGVVIRVEGYDWNCPKYITPRYTREEFARVIEAARAQKAGEPAAVASIGQGELDLVVSGVSQLTPRIRAFELRAAGGGELPPVAAGAHLDLPVQLADGSLATRAYSLAQDPARCDVYEIAVLREPGGRGGSEAIHAHWRLGTRLHTSRPVNAFPLHTDRRQAVLIAGGIGITPLKAMAHALARRGTPFRLHYSAATPAEMAWRDLLATQFGDACTFHFSRAPGGRRIDLDAVFASLSADAVAYVCGPAALIDAARATAARQGVPAARVQFESFE